VPSIATEKALSTVIVVVRHQTQFVGLSPRLKVDDPYAAERSDQTAENQRDRAAPLCRGASAVDTSITASAARMNPGSSTMCAGIAFEALWNRRTFRD